MLVYWIEHNKEHAQDFKRWAEKARGFNKIEAHGWIMEAVKHVEEANECLFKAFEDINNKDKKDKNKK